MTILVRYVGASVLRATLLVLMVILSLYMVGELLEQTGDFRGDYGLADALLYLLLRIPSVAVDMLPFAALIGCLIGIGALSNNSELTVMRAAGVSALQVVGMVLRPTIALILAGALISEFLAPQMDQLAQSRKDILRGVSDRQQVGGIWMLDGDDYLHVNSVYPNGILFGVSRFRRVAQELQAVSFSERAVYEAGTWTELNLRETRFGTDSTQASLLGERVWSTVLTPQILDMASLRPGQLSIRDLRNFADYLGQETRRAGPYRLEFWNKLLLPFTVTALVLVGLSFVYGASRSVPMGQRIFVGVIAAVVFKLVQDILGPASMVWGFAPWLAVAAPIFVTLLLGLWLLARQR